MTTGNDEFVLPEILDVSPETVAAADAALDPSIHPPTWARTDEYNGDTYYRWSENLVIEKVQRTASPKGYTEFFIQAKIRPNEHPENKNVGRRVFSRYRINFKVLNGLEKNPKHEIMNRLSMPALTSLIRSSGWAPTDRTAGLPASLLTQLFPAKIETHESQLVGAVLIGNICDRPNKGENSKRPRQSEVESWLPSPVTE